MLIRISLIVAILAGIGVGVLNFVKVKEKIVALQNDRDNEKKMKETAQADASKTHATLKKTETELKQTKATLDQTAAELAAAAAERDRKAKEAEELTSRLRDTSDKLEKSQQELSRFSAIPITPDEAIALKEEFKVLQNKLDEADIVNKALAREKVRLANKLAIYTDQGTNIVELPAELKGKVVAMDPKWNFVVVNLGADQGVLELGELLVNRSGRLVGKIIVREVKKDHCIANLLEGWQIGEILEGDEVIPAHPASS
jgi:DNA repair exonuclease SbcCD ATPase subunit